MHMPSYNHKGSETRLRLQPLSYEGPDSLQLYNPLAAS